MGFVSRRTLHLVGGGALLLAAIALAVEALVRFRLGALTSGPTRPPDPLAGVLVLLALGAALVLAAAAVALLLHPPPGTTTHHRRRRDATPEDALAAAADATGRMRRVLHDAAERGTHLDLHLDALAAVGRVGVVIAHHDGPRAATPRALELLGVPSLAALAAEWRTLGPRLLRESSDLERNGAVRAVSTTSGADGSRIVVLSDPTPLEVLEGDVRLASQIFGLTRAYRALAHELRAPLGALTLHLDLMSETLASDAPAQRHLGVIRGEIERLNRCLVGILSKVAPADEPARSFDLRDPVDAVAALVGPQARSLRVALQACSPERPVRIMGHRDRLHQALLGIVVNALEAMPDGGQLRLGLEADDTEATLVVTDTGRGIAAEDQERIYELDFTTKSGGHGVGLAVARALVEMHGGSIALDSAAGRGTRVEIRLPLSRLPVAGA